MLAYNDQPQIKLDIMAYAAAAARSEHYKREADKLIELLQAA